MVQKFTQTCEGAKYLLEQFELFRQNNQQGIDFNITKPKELGEIFKADPTFHKYSSKTFAQNFKTHANNYKVSLYKERGRTQCEI